MSKKWSSFAEQQLLTENFRNWLREGEEEDWRDFITSEDNLEALANMTVQDREEILNKYLDQIIGAGDLSPEERIKAIEDAEKLIGDIGDEGADPNAIKPEDIKVGAVFVSTNAKGDEYLVKITGPAESPEAEAKGMVMATKINPETCEPIRKGSTASFVVFKSKLSKSDSKCAKGAGGDQSESRVRTPIGKRIEKLLTGVDSPREYIDFLIIMRKIIENPKFIERAKLLGRKAKYDQNDLLALKRLIIAFEKDEAGKENEQ